MLTVDLERTNLVSVLSKGLLLQKSTFVIITAWLVSSVDFSKPNIWFSVKWIYLPFLNKNSLPWLSWTHILGSFADQHFIVTKYIRNSSCHIWLVSYSPSLPCAPESLCVVPAQVLRGQQVSKALLYPVLQKTCVCSALRGQQHHSLIDWCPLWGFVAPRSPLVCIWLCLLLLGHRLSDEYL